MWNTTWVDMFEIQCGEERGDKEIGMVRKGIGWETQQRSLHLIQGQRKPLEFVEQENDMFRPIFYKSHFDSCVKDGFESGDTQGRKIKKEPSIVVRV